MKRFALLLGLALGVPVTASADQLTSSIDAANYHLCEALRAQRTYCGTLVNAQAVQIQAWKFPNLIVGIAGGLSNGILGTRFGDRKLPAWEYVIRLDQPDGNEAEIVTVVQGGRLIEPGTPVFVTTGAATEYRTFGVRVIAATRPETYGQVGLEEARISAMRRR